MAKVGTSKTLEYYEGSTISLHGSGASGAYAPGPDEKKKKKSRQVVCLVLSE